MNNQGHFGMQAPPIFQSDTWETELSEGFVQDPWGSLNAGSEKK